MSGFSTWVADMRIALATCRDLPEWEVDDAPLHAALRARGVDLRTPAWDDARFDWAACDACLIRTTWDYMERRDEFVAWAESVGAATRLFNPAPIVRWNTYKTYLRDIERRGAPVVPTVWIDAGRPIDVGAVMSQRGWAAGFLKPVVGATARETLRFRHTAEGLAAAAAHIERLTQREALMLQPYLPRVETDGELSVVYIDGRPSHVVRKQPKPGDYRVQDDHGATDQRWDLDTAERARVAMVMAAARAEVEQRNLCAWPPLYARVDLLRDEEGELCCNELELVEPSLFFRHSQAAAERLAAALIARIG
ncbi:MAG: hypothetical protein D6744_13160 [Planctomycetota bacterium]|nr:MAG: hypothetical protein D6744_13160 [Planctomycetota bacterium]